MAAVESVTDGLPELARQLRARARTLAQHMLAAYRTEIPQYARIDDPHVLADMTEISLAGLGCWLDVLEYDRPVDSNLLHPVLAVIRRRALQGVGMEAMMRAYRLAARVVWQEILELPVTPELVGPLSTRMLEFTDRLTTAAEQAYAEESRARPEPDVSRSAIFESVLSGRSAPPRDAPWFAEPHCVVLVEAAGMPDDPSEPPLTPADLAAALVREVRAAYWTTRINGVAAACPIDGPEGRDVLIRRLSRFTNARHPLSVAVGGIARGAAATRNSHHEAIEAMRIGERLPRRERRVHDGQELSTLALLLADPDRARRFAEGCLYPLGRLVERGWVLPTLAAYLRSQGSLKEAAAELAVHPSTVKYRLNELRPFLDVHAADGDQATTLLLAVRVLEYFAWRG